MLKPPSLVWKKRLYLPDIHWCSHWCCRVRCAFCCCSYETTNYTLKLCIIFLMVLVCIKYYHCLHFLSFSYSFFTQINMGWDYVPNCSSLQTSTNLLSRPKRPLWCEPCHPSKSGAFVSSSMWYILHSMLRPSAWKGVSSCLMTLLTSPYFTIWIILSHQKSPGIVWCMLWRAIIRMCWLASRPHPWIWYIFWIFLQSFVMMITLTNWPTFFCLTSHPGCGRYRFFNFCMWNLPNILLSTIWNTRGTASRA